MSYSCQTHDKPTFDHRDIGRGISIKFCCMWTLVVALVLVHATKFRFLNMPIGIGELLLVLWGFFVMARTGLSGFINWTPATTPLLMFWLVSFSCLGVGIFVSNRLGIVTVFPQPYYNLIAITFAAIVSLAVTFSFDSDCELDLLIKRIFILFLSLQSVLFAVSFIAPEPMGINLFNSTQHHRFVGLAENPNQLGIYLCIAPFACLAWYNSCQSYIRPLAAIFFIFAIVLGFYTRSDALYVAWIAGVLTIAAHFVFKLIVARRYLNLALVGIVFFTTSVIITFNFSDIQSSAGNLLETLYVSEKNQGGVRIALWQNAIESWSFSPLVGLGPGSFSSVEGIDGVLRRMEAHNTPLDWATQTGVIGLISMTVLAGLSFARAWRSRRCELVAAACSVVVFSQFHYVVRQPIVWAFLVYLLLQKPRPKNQANLNRYCEHN